MSAADQGSDPGGGDSNAELPSKRKQKSGAEKRRLAAFKAAATDPKQQKLFFRPTNISECRRNGKTSISLSR